jgi:hypothetical protein
MPPRPHDDPSLLINFNIPYSLHCDLMQEADAAGENRSRFIRDAVQLRILLIREERAKGRK